MRFVADNEEDYKVLSHMQKLVTGQFKLEQAKDNPSEKLIGYYKKVMNTPIEKVWVRPDKEIQKANSAVMDTEDPNLFIAYIVQAAVSRKKLAIEYVSGKGDVSKRIIEPMNWKNDSVVGWDHLRGSWRQFKPKNMQRVAILDEGFDRDEDVEITLQDAKTMAHLVM